MAQFKKASVTRRSIGDTSLEEATGENDDDKEYNVHSPNPHRRGKGDAA